MILCAGCRWYSTVRNTGCVSVSDGTLCCVRVRWYSAARTAWCLSVSAGTLCCVCQVVLCYKDGLVSVSVSWYSVLCLTGGTLLQRRPGVRV